LKRKVKHVISIIIATASLTAFAGCTGATNQTGLSGTAPPPTATIEPAVKPEPLIPPLNESSEQPIYSETEQQPQLVDERYTAMNTYTTEYTTGSGYNLKATLNIGNWIKSSDDDAVTAAWGSIGGIVSPLSYLDGMGAGYRKDRSIVAFGTLQVGNDTPGWDITAEYPLEINLNFLAKNEIGQTAYNMHRLAIDYSSGMEYGRVYDSKFVAIGANMKSNHWGPVRFMLAMPSVFSPNTPNGDEKPNYEYLFSWGSYTAGGDLSISVSLDKSWEIE
jgi:hypothetical protein